MVVDMFPGFVTISSIEADYEVDTLTRKIKVVRLRPVRVEGVKKAGDKVCYTHVEGVEEVGNKVCYFCGKEDEIYYRFYITDINAREYLNTLYKLIDIDDSNELKKKVEEYLKYVKKHIKKKMKFEEYLKDIVSIDRKKIEKYLNRIRKFSHITTKQKKEIEGYLEYINMLKKGHKKKRIK